MLTALFGTTMRPMVCHWNNFFERMCFNNHYWPFMKYVFLIPIAKRLKPFSYTHRNLSFYDYSWVVSLFPVAITQVDSHGQIFRLHYFVTWTWCLIHTRTWPWLFHVCREIWYDHVFTMIMKQSWHGSHVFPTRLNLVFGPICRITGQIIRKASQ